MNIVSNFVGSLSPEMFGNSINGMTQSVDLGDTTFADLLEKQINNAVQKDKTDFTNGFGIPSVPNVVDTDGTFSQLNVNTKQGENNDMFESVKPVNESEGSVFKDVKDMSTSEVVTFFDSLFDSKPKLTDTSLSELFEFEQKIAAGKYDKYAKNVITDLSEFVTDTIRMKTED